MAWKALTMADPKKPEVLDFFRTWKMNRWPGMPPRNPDWSDVETAFKAGFFMGLLEANEHTPTSGVEGTPK